jgi:hypothetical protein
VLEGMVVLVQQKRSFRSLKVRLHPEAADSGFVEWIVSEDNLY